MGLAEIWGDEHKKPPNEGALQGHVGLPCAWGAKPLEACAKDRRRMAEMLGSVHENPSRAGTP